MTAYADRTWAQRLEVMKTCTAAGSEFHHRTPSGFRVAIGRGKYAETVAALAALGFACVDLYTFPLGTDKPAANLRHDSKGFPACCWLFADFREVQP